MSSEGPSNSADCLFKWDRVRALEEVSSISIPQSTADGPLGSMQLLIHNPFEGIMDEQIMEPSILCGIMIGGSDEEVATRIREMDQYRASESSATEMK